MEDGGRWWIGGGGSAGRWRMVDCREVEGGGLRWRVVDGGGGWWIEVEGGGGWWVEG